MSERKLTAFITGAANGIGRATASALAEQGFRVWIADCDIEAGEQAVADLSARNLDASFVPLDVTDLNAVEAAANIVARETPALDVLINNAGIALENIDENGQMTRPSELSLDMLRKTFDVNFFGAIAVTQAFLPLLRNSAAGRVVNMTSGLGSLLVNSEPESPAAPWDALGYKSSKAALNMATILFARELRDTPIKVNAATPPLVLTKASTSFCGPAMVARGGFDTPEEGARVLVKLATLPNDGPTGEFHEFEGPHPW